MLVRTPRTAFRGTRLAWIGPRRMSFPTAPTRPSTYPRAACHHAVSLRWFSGRKRFVGQLHGRKHRQQLCCQRDAVGAVENGIVNGSNGKLNPKNNATRAEVAAILMRL
ncbi:S-layer homology domain-containing protein [Agathobaculum sp.]|uniref:S-layer homology domain-containing protein n=1 Tax=Agathobaculum sp. TaxID=2048138 RepID=UPI003AB250B4